MERSLVLVKPDAVERGLTGAIISRLEAAGVKLVALKMLRMDKDMARQHYAVHKEKPFFGGLVKYITSGPIVASVFEGKGAVEMIRKKMGATDPAKATAFRERVRSILVRDSGAPDYEERHGAEAPTVRGRTGAGQQQRQRPDQEHCHHERRRAGEFTLASPAALGAACAGAGDRARPVRFRRTFR